MKAMSTQAVPKKGLPSPGRNIYTSPPKKGEDPFDVNALPKNLGYVARMKDGVIYVYDDQAAADKGQPRALPCTDYDTFIDDMNFLIALIAQGPT
jgi:AMP deaminase